MLAVTILFKLKDGIAESKEKWYETRMVISNGRSVVAFPKITSSKQISLKLIR